MIRIACVGDSITRGFGIYRRSRYCYPAVLGRMLGTEYEVRNFGVNSRTAMNKADFPYTMTRKYNESIEFQPDIVLMMLGSNDTKTRNWDRETFDKEYTELLEKYQSLDSHPRVVIMLPPTIFSVMGSYALGHSKEFLDQELIPILNDIAGKTKLEVIDLHSVIRERTLFNLDGLHPNHIGAKMIAERIFNFLNS